MTNDVEQANGQQPLRVVVFADFVCPYSFIAQHELDQLEREYGLHPEWRPHWLHPETPPEGESVAGAVDPERRQAVTKWLREMSPEMTENIRFPDRRQYSFRAFQAMAFARDHSLDSELRAAIFDALWVRGEDIGEIETLQAAAERAGLDAAEMGRALHDPAYHQRAVEEVNTAQRIGITQTPTMILGRTAVLGWHYYEALQTVVEQQGLAPLAQRPSN